MKKNKILLAPIALFAVSCADSGKAPGESAEQLDDAQEVSVPVVLDEAVADTVAMEHGEEVEIEVTWENEYTTKPVTDTVQLEMEGEKKYIRLPLVVADGYTVTVSGETFTCKNIDWNTQEWVPFDVVTGEEMVQLACYDYNQEFLGNAAYVPAPKKHEIGTELKFKNYEEAYRALDAAYDAGRIDFVTKNVDADECWINFSSSLSYVDGKVSITVHTKTNGAKPSIELSSDVTYEEFQNFLAGEQALMLTNPLLWEGSLELNVISPFANHLWESDSGEVVGISQFKASVTQHLKGEQHDAGTIYFVLEEEGKEDAIAEIFRSSARKKIQEEGGNLGSQESFSKDDSTDVKVGVDVDMSVDVKMQDDNEEIHGTQHHESHEESPETGAPRRDDNDEQQPSPAGPADLDLGAPSDDVPAPAPAPN